jgi:hypothetical protein
MTNGPMMDDRELDVWREQWRGVAPLSTELQRQVQAKIKLQDRRFWLGNLLALAAFAGMLILAFYQLSHPTSGIEKGQAIGVCVLLFVAVTCRLWLMRGTWRAETQSVYAFMELWQRRVLSRIRGLRIGTYIAITWLGFAVVLMTTNRTTIMPEIIAHPAACVALMVFIGLMLGAIWFGVTSFRRRKVAELNEVTRLLEQIRTAND